MISFEKAISVATENAKTLVKSAKNIELEGVVLSQDNRLYEVALSYDLQGKNPLDIDEDSGNRSASNLIRLAAIMGNRREYKVFLVDSNNGQFKGFKNYKDR